MRIHTNTPHVEPDWAESFLLELRLRRVDGRRIGAALAEVEAHCAESGESARDAFGDPATYAVELAPADPGEPLDWRRELVSSLLGLGGMLSTLAAVGAWQADAEVRVTTGAVGMLVLVLVGTVLIVRHGEALLRVVVRRWWVAVVGSMVPIVLFVAVLLLGQHPLVTVPVLPALSLGLVFLIGNTVLTLRHLDPSDPVVGPDGVGGVGTLGEDVVSRSLERIGPWLFPVLTALMAVPLLLL